MNSSNQIKLIKKFIESNENDLLINQVDEKVSFFYLNMIRYFANQQSVKIIIDASLEFIGSENDLFKTKKISIFYNTNIKKIRSILDLNTKKIIFTDYKNYKNLNSKVTSINGYKFENDINFFVRNELNINNDELLNYCINNPALLFSETSKYLINNHNYFSSPLLNEEKNNILKIRRLIFEIKKNNFSIKNLYLNIKDEAKYKKLNFLTY